MRTAAGRLGRRFRTLTTGNRGFVARRRTAERSQDGFTLIEMMVALLLLAIVMTAFASTLMGAMKSSGDARETAVAATVADTALDNARAVTPSSDLLQDGPAAAGVTFLTASIDNVELAPETTTLDNRTYTTNLYAGICYLQAGTSSTPASCTTSVQSGQTAALTTMIRVTAEVNWSQPSGCAGGTCAYITSTLISDVGDSLLVNAGAAPGAPSGLSATYGTNGQPTLSWSKPLSSYSISSYTITATTGSTSTSYTATSSPYTFSGLTLGKTYSVTVTATSTGGTSEPSSAINVTPTAPPANFRVSSKTSNALTVAWTATSGATGYTVTISGNGMNQSQSTTGTSYQWTGLSKQTTYTLTVTATWNGGSSASSTTSSAG